MKVAYLVHFRGGSESGILRKVASQTAAWRTLGADVGLFVATSPGAQPAWRALPGAVSVRTPPGGPLALLREREALVRDVEGWQPDVVYLRETELTAPGPEIAAFAAASAGDMANPLLALHRLLDALHRRITFDTEPTHVATTAREAFALRRGVCQDLTHIFIASARCLGIPARYVSGYFLRADGVIDQDAGHAWAEAKVPDLGEDPDYDF